MRVVCISNQKGGTGKTTTCVNLAAALAAEHGLRVLVIDMDPQANTSAWFGVVEEGRGILDALAGDVPLHDLVQPTEVDGVDIVPATEWLVRLEPTLLGEVGAEFCFRDAVRSLPQDRWDLVLVDCTPSLGLLVVSVLAAADEIVVPVEIHIMPVAGLAALVKTVTRVQERLNPTLRISGILPSRAQPRTVLYRQVLDRLKETFGDAVLSTHIRENIRIAEAPSFQRPITEYAPRSAGAEDFRALAAELIDRWNNADKDKRKGDTKWATA